MKLTISIAIVASLVASAMAAPISNGTNTTDTCHHYSIDNFSYNLQYTVFYSLVSFTIGNTEAATPSFVCSPAETEFEPGSVYTCTQDPTFSFSYNSVTNDLSLWEQVDGGVVTGDAVVGAVDCDQLTSDQQRCFAGQNVTVSLT